MFISKEEKKQLEDDIKQANMNIDSLYKKLNIREKELQELREQRSSMEVQINEIKSAIDLLYESRGEYVPKSQFAEILNKRINPEFADIGKAIFDIQREAASNRKEMVALGEKIRSLYLTIKQLTKKVSQNPVKNIRKKAEKK
jgi:chromosome segregation ATPase